MMLTAFKLLGVSLLAVALIWALVLGWWQGNDHSPSTTELFLYLGALPLSVVGGYWLLRGFIEHIKTPVVPPALPQKEVPDPLTSESAKTAAKERAYTTYLIGVSAVSGGGEAPSDILVSLTSGIRPKPDATLLDDAGFPVFTSPVNALDLEGIDTRLALHDARLAQALEGVEHRRMLALIDLALPPALAQAKEALATAVASRVSVIWLMPPSISQSLTPGLQSWLQAEYLSAFDPSHISVVLRHASTDAEVMAQIDHVVLESNNAPKKELTLVFGAVSTIGASTVSAWSGQNVLFSADCQNGWIPGESAACLLFGEPANGEEAVQLSRVCTANRDKSVDAGGRITGGIIEQLITGLLTIHALEPVEIKAVVSDGDHRPNRTTELLDALGNSLTELDPIADCLHVGIACGSSAPFGALLALACASAQSLSLAQPVICVSQQHVTARSAVLLRPTSFSSDGLSVGA